MLAACRTPASSRMGVSTGTWYLSPLTLLPASSPTGPTEGTPFPPPGPTWGRRAQVDADSDSDADADAGPWTRRAWARYAAASLPTGRGWAPQRAPRTRTT